MSAWTFTRFENPQRLADIMRRAWRIVKATSAAFGASLKQAWAEARAAAGAVIPAEPPSLLSFLRGIGIKPSPELHQLGIPICILRRNGWPIDLAARLATDAGYEIDECVSRLIEHIRDETFGHRHYARGDLAAVFDRADWHAYHAELMDQPAFEPAPF
jgi:hypothetical protein